MLTFFENLSQKKRARTATAAEEFSQSIQVPSSTHPGTTYPVRAIPHSDIYIYIYICFLFLLFFQRSFFENVFKLFRTRSKRLVGEAPPPPLKIGVRDCPYGICCPWVRGGWDMDALGKFFRRRRRRRRPRPLLLR